MWRISILRKKGKQMAKQKPVAIKTSFPTVEEVRKKFGVSKKRAKQIEKIMDEIFKGVNPRGDH